MASSLNSNAAISPAIVSHSHHEERVNDMIRVASCSYTHGRRHVQLVQSFSFEYEVSLLRDERGWLLILKTLGATIQGSDAR